MFLLFLLFSAHARALDFTEMLLDLQDFLDQQDGEITIEGVDLRKWIKDLRIYQEKLVVVENYLYFNNFSLFNTDIINVSAVDTSYDTTKMLTVSLSISTVNLSSTDIHVPIIPDPTHVSIEVHDLRLSIPIVWNYQEDGYISSVSIDSNSITVEKGSVEVDSDKYEIIIESLLDTYLSNIFQRLIADNIPAIINSIFDKLNEYGNPYLSILQTQKIENWAEKLFNIDPNSIKDLRTASVIDTFRFLFNVFVAPGGQFDINWFLGRLTNNTGTFPLSLYQDTLNFTMPINMSISVPNVADLNFTIKELILSGINTFQDFNFFNASNGYTFDSSFGLSNFSINVEFGLAARLFDNQQISFGGNTLSIDDNITLSITNNKIGFQLQLVSPKDAGSNYTDAQCLNLPCIAAIFNPNETRTNSLHAHSIIEVLSVLPSTGSSSSENLEYLIFSAIQSTIDFLQTEFASVFDFYVNAFINVYIIPSLNTKISDVLASSTCPYFDYERSVSFNLMATMIGIAACAALLIILYLFMCYAEPFRNQIRYQRISKLASNGEFDLSSLVSIDGTKEFENSGFCSQLFRDDNKGSLLMNKKLPIWVRMLIPLLIFMNIAVFISSNWGLGIQILLKIYISESRVVELPSLFDFYLLKSAVDIWNSNAEFLASLITIFSIIWPYVKLFLMLLVWTLPTTFLNKKHREGILKVLDALGKWSFFDTFAMSVIIAVFGVVLEFPVQDPACPQSLIFRLMTKPDYAFFALAIGTVFSLTISHIMLALHRYVDDVLDESEDNEKKSIYKVCKNLFISHSITLGIILNIVIYGIGISIRAFSMNFVGLTGYIMSLLDLENIRHYSVFNIASKVIETAENPNSFGIRFVQVLYIIIAMIIPFLHLICLFVLWIIPFPRKIQIYVYKLSEILHSWSSLDVLTFGLVCAMPEIASFGKSLALQWCAILNNIIATYYSDLPFVPGHELCFDAYAVSLPGTWFLLAGAIMENFLSIVINIYSKRVLGKNTPSDAANSNETKSFSKYDDIRRLV